MLIRRYLPHDHDQVWDLHNRALLAVNAHGGNGAWDDDLHHIEQEYLDRQGEFLVGETAGAVVAMGALKRIDAHTAEIKRMRVCPSCQRQGHGRRILVALESSALELGYGSLILETTLQQVAAIALYTRSGYGEIDRRRVASFDVLVLRKTLPSARLPRGEVLK